MAKKVQHSDLISKDVLQPTIEQAKALVEALNAVELKMVDLVKTTQAAATANKKFASGKDIEKQKKAAQELTEAEKILKKAREDKAKLAAKIRTLDSKEVQTQQKLQELARERKKSLKDIKILQDGQINTLEKLNARNRQLRKERNKLNLDTEKGKKRLQEINAELDKNNKKIKDNSDKLKQQKINVGNYKSALQGAKSALIGFAGALGVTAGLSGLVNVFKNAVGIAKEFEQSNANLAAVLGTSADKITALTEDAKRLGAATAFSASEVSSLQTEFAKLGFTETEILNATEATLSLAAATGSDLAEAAGVAGATLGGFGLDAEETGRVTDVMAKSFSTSALDMEKFRESMKSAAPAAKAVGIDVEETTALLGTLANAGISGSKAGNNLKTSFINLNKAGLTLDQGLEQVANSQNKLATATELVGKNAAASFLVLAEGVEETEKLEVGLRNAGGAAEKMAREQLNTLDGRLKILNSAWEGFVLGLLSGDSAFSKFSKTIVEGATNLLSFLTTQEGINKEWLSQRENIKSLNIELTNNADRYDELKAKTELTKDEQTELDGIIQKIAEDVPTAVSEVDKYGKALDISTDATRDFIKQQKNLLLVKNAEAIEEQEENLAALNKEYNDLQKTLIRQDGVYKKVIINQRQGTKRLVEATNEEVAAFFKANEQIQTRIDGTRTYIAELKGEQTEVEKAKKAEEEAAEAKREAAESQDELNKKLLEAASARIKEREEREKAELAFEKQRAENKKSILEDETEAQKSNFDIQLDNLDDYFEEVDAAEDKAIANSIKKKEEENEALAKLNEQRRKEAIATIQQISQAFNDSIDDEFAERNDAIDNEIKLRQDSVRFNQELIAAGNTDAAEQLRFEQEQLAKAEIKKKEIARREAAAKRAIQIVDAYFAAFERRSSDPDTEAGQAGIAALGDVAKGVALSEVAKALAGASFAYEGTENVDGKSAIYDRKSKIDRYLYWLHPNERVMTDKQNAKVGNMSNDQLANLAQDYQNGNLQPYQFQSQAYLSSMNGLTENVRLEMKLSTLSNAVQNNARIVADAINNKEVASFEIDGMLNVVETIKKKGNTERRVHKRF